MQSRLLTLWTRRDLIGELTRQDLAKGTRDTLLGWLWWLLDPLLMTAMYTVVVGLILNRGKHHQPYPAFLLCGLLAWRFFSGSLTEAIGVLSRRQGLIAAYSFPTLVLPASSVAANLLLFLVSLVPLCVVIGVYHAFLGHPQIGLGAAVVYLPLVVAVQLVLTLAAAVWLACAGAFFPDLRNIMHHVLRVGWYASPGIYAVSDVIAGYDGVGSVVWRWPVSLYLLNPMAHLIEAYRSVLLYNRPPDPVGLGATLLAGAAGLAAGLAWYGRQEHKFAKVV
ncbi:MAG TPA: hypothetical protein VML55_07380 [Planctomycetaceae bacterium]|nr:hypothetical protein [Planctomycetaceae bacterium]